MKRIVIVLFSVLCLGLFVQADQKETVKNDSTVAHIAAMLTREQRIERSKHFTTKGLIREIGSGKTEGFQMRQVGAGGTRAFGKKAEINYDALAETLAWIGGQACSGAKSPKVKGITFKRIEQPNGEWDFEFENHTSLDYHINVLHVHKRSKMVSLCYVIEHEVKMNACPVTPSGYCSCGMDIFFPNSDEDLYILIALEEPYDSYVLDNELPYYRTDKAQKKVETIQYMW